MTTKSLDELLIENSTAIVDFESAQLLKELEFNYSNIFDIYLNSNKIHYANIKEVDFVNQTITLAPQLNLVRYWLLLKFGFNIEIEITQYSCKDNPHFTVKSVNISNDKFLYVMRNFTDYNKALQEGITRTLQHMIDADKEVDNDMEFKTIKK